MLAQVFATFGLAVLLRSAAQFLFGTDFHTVKAPLLEGRVALGPVFIGVPQLAASVTALGAFLALYLFLSRSETGLALQATAQDRQAASLMGINTQRMFALGWVIGSACVGVAGGLLAMFFYIFPDVGATFALLAYVTVALGGFGNVPATLAGGRARRPRRGIRGPRPDPGPQVFRGVRPLPRSRALAPAGTLRPVLIRAALDRPAAGGPRVPRPVHPALPAPRHDHDLSLRGPGHGVEHHRRLLRPDFPRAGRVLRGRRLHVVAPVQGNGTDAVGGHGSPAPSSP